MDNIVKKKAFRSTTVTVATSEQSVKYTRSRSNGGPAMRSDGDANSDSDVILSLDDDTSETGLLIGNDIETTSKRNSTTHADRSQHLHVL